MQELLYTSVPRGLKPGSRGFCTVLSTQGMVAPLAAALEALSGYRPVFPIGHARVAENPVVYSHLKLQVAGKSWYVLSRVADYGLDYSQRTNKLAHHLVLDKSELPAAGPASLLRASGIMRESWEGEPKIVPPKPMSKHPIAPSGMCQAWKEMIGDAGWAGVLAESFLKDSNRPVILLFEPGQDLRPLIDESLSLLPAERRWDVTFSTYFTGSSQGITCLWRGIVLGSKEATESLRFVNALRIDLTSTDIGRAEGGELVDAARKGIRPTARPTVPPKQAEPREQQEPRAVVMDDADKPASPRTAITSPAIEMGTVQVGGSEQTSAPPRLSRSAFKFANAGRQTDNAAREVRPTSARRVIIPVLIILMLGGSVATIIALNRPRPNSQALNSTEPQQDPSTSPAANSSATATTAPATDDNSTGKAPTTDHDAGSVVTATPKDPLNEKPKADKPEPPKENPVASAPSNLPETTTKAAKADDPKASPTSGKTPEAKPEPSATASTSDHALSNDFEVFDIFDMDGFTKEAVTIPLAVVESDDVEMSLLLPMGLNGLNPKMTKPSSLTINGGPGGVKEFCSLRVSDDGKSLIWNRDPGSRKQDVLSRFQFCLLQVGRKQPRLFRFQNVEVAHVQAGSKPTFASRSLKAASISNLQLHADRLTLTDGNSLALALPPKKKSTTGIVSWAFDGEELREHDLKQITLWITPKSGDDPTFEINGKLEPRDFKSETRELGKKVLEHFGEQKKEPPTGKSADANLKLLKEQFHGKLGPSMQNLEANKMRNDEQEKRLKKLKTLVTENESLQRRIQDAIEGEEAISESKSIATSIFCTIKRGSEELALKVVEIRGRQPSR